MVCNLTGVMLLVRQDVPHSLLAGSVALAHDPSEQALCGNDRRKMLSFVGLFAPRTAADDFDRVDVELTSRVQIYAYWGLSVVRSNGD